MNFIPKKTKMGMQPYMGFKSKLKRKKKKKESILAIDWNKDLILSLRLFKETPIIAGFTCNVGPAQFMWSPTLTRSHQRAHQ